VGTSLLPPWPWPSPADLRGVPRTPRAPSSEDDAVSASVAFAPVQSSRTARVRVNLTFLSWDSSRWVGLLRGRRTAGFPFIDIAPGVHSREALRLRFGREGATLPACSALVVSHHLGGFLLRSFRGLVASRCRSWGSSRFRRASTRLTEARRPLPDSLAAFPATSVSYPSKDDPRLQPHHVTVAVASLVFGPPLSRRASPSRPCSAVESGLLRAIAGVGRGPVLPGLGSPSRSFEAVAHPR